MNEHHDLNSCTPATFKLIADCVKNHKIKYLENDLNQHIFTFKDNSQLSIKVDRGIADRHVLSPRRCKIWLEVKIEEL